MEMPSMTTMVSGVGTYVSCLPIVTNGPSASVAKVSVKTTQPLIGRKPAQMTAPRITARATHGRDATFSLNPPGNDEIHSNDIQPNSGLRGFGTKNASRSTPCALFRHQTSGRIQPRCPKLDVVTDSSGERMATHT